MNETMAGRLFRRRGFMTVGAAGFGLTLADFFRLKSARADLKSYAPITAKADSIIHIFLPGGIAHQETFDPKPFAPVEYRGELSTIADQGRGRGFQPDACRILPRLPTRSPWFTVDDPRRGRARARHAQHVHGISAQPGLAISEHGERGFAHEFGPKNNLPPYVCVPSMPNVYAGHRLPELILLPFQPRERPMPSGGFKVQDLNLPGGIDDSRFATRRHVLDAVNDHFAKKEKGGWPGGDGYVL